MLGICAAGCGEVRIRQGNMDGHQAYLTLSAVLQGRTRSGGI